MKTKGVVYRGVTLDIYSASQKGLHFFVLSLPS